MTDLSNLLWWCKKASCAWNRNLVEIESWFGNEHQRNCLCCLWHLTAWAHIVLNHLHSLPTLSLSTEGLSNTQSGDQGISMGYSHVSIKCCGNIHCCISCLATFLCTAFLKVKGTSFLSRSLHELSRNVMQSSWPQGAGSALRVCLQW